jgi:outer membrane beta-barrel protein
MYSFALLSLASLSNFAHAQETIDIGTLKNTEIKVVQKILYIKSGKSEYGGHFGLMPFDAYTITPKIDLTYGQHLSEVLMWEAGIGLGYGIKNGTFSELEGPSYGITPDAYRYLSSVHACAQYSPIYAKMTWDGSRIFHHDMYVLAGGVLAIEQAFMEDGTLSVAPGVSIGLGARIFLPNGNIIRLQLRDDILFQGRAKTAAVQGFYLKQNTSISVGYTLLRK